MSERKKLGEVLTEAGLIDQYQLKSALAHQRQWGGRIGAIFVKLGFISDEELVAFLSKAFSMPSVNLYAVRIPAPIIELVPADVAKKYGIVPLQHMPEKKRIVVAMSDPTNLAVLDEAQFLVSARLVPVVSSYAAIDAAIAHYYDRSAKMELLPGAKLSTEVDLFAPNSEVAARVSRTGEQAADAGGKIEISEEEDDSEVVTGEVEADDDLGDDLLVFTGGTEKTIKLDEGVVTAAPAPAAKPSSRATAPKPKEAPSADELVMALIKVLIDKGFITKEEILSRLK